MALWKSKRVRFIQKQELKDDRADIPILFLTCSVEDVKKSDFLVNDTLFTV
jgi:hypothetical protein